MMHILPSLPHLICPAFPFFWPHRAFPTIHTIPAEPAAVLPSGLAKPSQHGFSSHGIMINLWLKFSSMTIVTVYLLVLWVVCLCVTLVHCG